MDGSVGPVRRRASDFDQELLDLFDGYVHGALDRRQFLDKAAKFAVGGLTAAALLDMLSPRYALAEQIKADDARITTQRVEYDSPNGNGRIKAYLTRPAGATGKVPGVVVVHENRGLNPYIEDVARRVAVAGFMALAPDGLTPLGGYPGNDDQGREMQRQIDGNKLREDFMAAFETLSARADCTGKVGVVGFCYGGGIANAMAARFPSLAASVPYYGRQADTADVPKIQAPLLIHYAGLDERINAGWPDYEAALKANNKAYTAHIYPDVNHGFHNDTTPRYDEAAATLSWDRTVAFFREHLA
jgi:carboxymethylenebutenolidase